MSLEPINIELTDAQRRYVLTRAAKAGVDAAEYLRSMVPSADEDGVIQVRNVTNGENALAVAERLGLVGATTGEPSDLATNPKHMEGFGQDGSHAR